MPRSSRFAARSALGAPSSFEARGKLGALEVGRFLAAGLVVVDHVLSDLPRYADGPGVRILGGWRAPGAFGVEYFFLLSGFVMLLAHHRDSGRMGAVPLFWWRRVIRIYPVIWLALPVPFLVLGAHWGLLQGLGIVSLIDPAVTRYIPPVWSLRYELVFYVIFGLALLPVVGRFILGGWMAVVAWRALPVGWQRFSTPGFTHAVRHFLVHQAGVVTGDFNLLFVAGLVTGGLYLGVGINRLAGAVLVLGGVGLLLAAGPGLGWYYPYANDGSVLVLGLGFGALMLGLAGLERGGALRLGTLAAKLGDVSYPLYILHMPLMLLFDAHCAAWLRLSAAGLYGLAAGGIMVMLAAAVLVTLLFDQPIQRALRPKIMTRRGRRS